MSDDESPSAEAEAPGPRRDPVRRWTAIVAGFLLLLLALQIASDRTAPVTSIATIEGLVLPISSRFRCKTLCVCRKTRVLRR